MLLRLASPHSCFWNQRSPKADSSPNLCKINPLLCSWDYAERPCAPVHKEALNLAGRRAEWWAHPPTELFTVIQATDDDGLSSCHCWGCPAGVCAAGSRWSSLQWLTNPLLKFTHFHWRFYVFIQVYGHILAWGMVHPFQGMYESGSI